MLPESLITIREYPSIELAAEDKALLDHAGVTSYVGGTHFRNHGPVELRVPEDELEIARGILGIALAAQARTEFPCPRCGAPALEARFPWTFVAIALFLTGLAALAATGLTRVGAAAIPVGILLVVVLDRVAPRWKCAQCGARLKALPEADESS